MTDWNPTRVWVENDQLTETRANDYLRENQDHLKEDRDPSLVNRDAGTLVVGDVVVLDVANTGVEKATTDAHAGPIYVVDTVGPTAVGTTLYVHKAGCTCQVKVNGAIVYGDLLKTSATAGRAAKTVVGTEAFARALQANASGDALILCELLPHPTYGTASIDFGEAADIAATSTTAAAGASGEVADAAHVHPLGAHNHNGTTGEGGELTSPRLLTDIKSAGGTNVLLQVINSKGLAIGSAANATTDTDPFLYITTSAGPPTGTPTAATGRVPLHYDTTSQRLYIYSGAWRLVPLKLMGAKVRHSVDQTVPHITVTHYDFDTEILDTDTLHFTSSANLTGTVTKTAASATLAGSGTSFSSELTVGQLISVPGTADEWRVVTAIANNTSLTVNANFTNSASGQTATRLNKGIVIRQAGIYVAVGTGNTSGGDVDGFRSAQLYKHSAGVSGIFGLFQGPPAPIGESTYLSVIGIDSFAQWDFVTMAMQQTSGSSLTSAQAGHTPSLSLVYLGGAS